MAEQLELPRTSDRKVLYQALLPQAAALLGGEQDAVAAMANLAAAIKQAFDWHWVGFYRVVEEELVLGPFQGPVACARIGHGKGVCGSAWAQDRTLIVPDVNEFPGHIACSSESASEIVLPLKGRSGRVAAVLDVDSVLPDDLTEVDAEGLAKLAALIEPLLP